MAGPRHQSPEPDRAPHTDQASNGERVPSNAETAETLREQADANPGSDARSSATHADGRRTSDPTGVHNEPSSDTERST